MIDSLGGESKMRNNFDKTKMVDTLMSWIERYDDRLHAGEQTAVIEEIKLRVTKDKELKEALLGFIDEVNDELRRVTP